MARVNHPGIVSVGEVIERGTTLIVRRWGLDLCANRCTCHRSPIDGQMHIEENQRRGAVGLKRYRGCNCCAAWEADELMSICRDLKAIQDFQAEDEAGETEGAS